MYIYICTGNDKTGQCYEVWRAGIVFKVLPFAFVSEIATHLNTLQHTLQHGLTQGVP